MAELLIVYERPSKIKVCAVTLATLFTSEKKSTPDGAFLHAPITPETSCQELEMTVGKAASLAASERAGVGIVPLSNVQVVAASKLPLKMQILKAMFS